MAELADHPLFERVRSHDPEPSTSSTLEVKMLLTIGAVARATGVATSALRYWEDVGLLPAPARVGGKRRYAASVVDQVGLILFLQEVGFTLRELSTLLASRTGSGPDGRDAWRDLARRKIAELDDRITQMHAARTAIAHGLACRHDDVFACPRFTGVVAARLAGVPLEEAHTHQTVNSEG
jgi:DNA-binding transcriptional MerR regulator